MYMMKMKSIEKDGLPPMTGEEYLTWRVGFSISSANGWDITTAQGQALWYHLKTRGFGISHYLLLPAKGPEIL